MNAITQQLLEMQDVGYRNFHASLMPTIEKKRIIGIRMPVLRHFAKDLIQCKGQTNIILFLQQLPHFYYEENNLHGMLLGLTIKEIAPLLESIDHFLPYVDNWATCDTLAPKTFSRHPDEVYIAVKRWLQATHIYTQRFAIVTLLQFFLDDNYRPNILNDVANVRGDDYYLKMAQAWFFSFVIIKHYEDALPYLNEHKLDKWVHNMTIRKAIESFRVDKSHKDFLRTLRWK